MTVFLSDTWSAGPCIYISIYVEFFDFYDIVFPAVNAFAVEILMNTGLDITWASYANVGICFMSVVGPDA